MTHHFLVVHPEEEAEKRSVLGHLRDFWGLSEAREDVAAVFTEILNSYLFYCCLIYRTAI
jgi:hypothetical protein